VDGQLTNPAFSAPITPPVALPDTQSKVTLGIRPEHLGLDHSSDQLTIELTEALGGVSYCYLGGIGDTRLIVEERGDHRSSEGETVGLNIPSDRIFLFDSETGARIR
jgi:lactose/L-arabinose transport system ATP-binding protein